MGGELAGRKCLDVGRRVFFIGIAGMAKRSTGSGAKPIVIFALPASEVVEGETAGAGVVGDFVVAESGGGEQLIREVEHGFICLFVYHLLPKLLVERCAFLVGQVVGGDVVGGEVESVFQGVPPLGECLPRQTEHEVDVHLGDAHLPQDLHTLGHLFGGVFAPEHAQGGGIHALHAERDAGDAKTQPLFYFRVGEGGGVGLKAPFLELG